MLLLLLLLLLLLPPPVLLGVGLVVHALLLVPHLPQS